MGRMEGDVAKGAPGVMLVAERSAALGTSGESSLALMLVGNDLLVRGEPLLRWMNPQDLASTLFTIDDAAEIMERESLNMGIASVLEALDHNRGALRDIVVPSGWVFA